MGKNTSSILNYLDYTFFVLFLILLSRSSFYFILTDNIRPLVLGIVLIYFIIRIIIYYTIEKMQIYWSFGILLTLAFLIISSIWSGMILTSIKLVIIQLIFPSIIIIYLRNKYSIIKLMKLTFVVGAIMAVFSFVVAILSPQTGLMHTVMHSGSWRGIFAHKNLLAVSMSLHLLLSLFLLTFVKKKASRIIIYLVLLLELSLVVLSRSSTAIVALIVPLLCIFLVLIVFSIKNRYLLMSLLSILIIFVTSVFVLVISNLEKITNMFGKDLTFSSRTIIWEGTINLIKEKLILGYGYGTFWNENSYTYHYVNRYLNVSGFEFNHAHNGFLDIFTNIGLLGFIFIFITMIVYISRCTKLLLKTKNKIYYFPFIFIVFLVVYNLQESYLLQQNFIMWTIYVFFYNFLSYQTKKIEN